MARVPRIPPGVVASAAIASVLCLLAPWVGSGRVDRSTIEVLSTASALDVLDGRMELVVLGAWFLLPVLAAATAVSAGWHRPRSTAAFGLPMGPVMMLAWWAVASSPLDARWGAALGGVLGMVTTLLGALLLIGSTETAEG